jgi:hypothetical protein
MLSFVLGMFYFVLTGSGALFFPTFHSTLAVYELIISIVFSLTGPSLSPLGGLGAGMDPSVEVIKLVHTPDSNVSSWASEAKTMQQILTKNIITFTSCLPPSDDTMSDLPAH